MNQIVFYLNGQRVSLYKPDPLMSLYEYLHRRNLFGARLAEGSGAFGTDNVTVVSWDGQKARYQAIGAYKLPLVRCHGKQIFTVEGIGNKTALHPIQEQFVKCESFQCGYCAGGFSMSTYTLLRSNPKPTEAQLLQALDGNMCRCTAFNPIAAAVASFASDIEDMPMCKEKVVFDESKEPAFPEELKTIAKDVAYTFDQISEADGSLINQIEYKSAGISGLSEAFAAGTHVVVLDDTSGRNLRSVCNPVDSQKHLIVDLVNQTQLHSIEFTSSGFVLGGSVTYTDLMEAFEAKGGLFKRVAEYIVMFRNTSLRNVQTVGSQLIQGGENDVNLLLAAMHAEATVVDLRTGQKKCVKVSELKNEADLLVEKVTVKQLPAFIYMTKRARRHANQDALIITCLAEFDGAMEVYVSGVPSVQFKKEEFLAPSTHLEMRAMLDKKFTFDKETTEDARVYGQFREAVVGNNVFICQVRYKLDHNLPVDAEYEAAVLLLERNTRYGEGLKMPRTERIIPESYRKTVGHPITSQTLRAKVAGDQMYSMDLDEFSNQMTHGAYVMTTVSFGKIVDIDISAAQKVPGFVGYVDENDIPNKKNGNCHSGIQFDTPVFVKNREVIHRSQPIGLVTATTREAAQLAASLVRVKYDIDDPAVRQSYIEKGLYHADIKTAMEHNSYLPNCGVNQRFITLGDGAEDFSKYDVVVEAENFMGGQEHMYFETHNCLVYPQSNGYMKVFSSTQNPAKMQFDIAWNLNNPDHATADETQIKQEDFIQNAQVEVEVMQLGGGFGGKQDRPMILCTAAAIAAFKTKKPVKLALNRDQDLVTMGGRHPYYFKYKAAIGQDGKYQAMNLLLVNDGGSTFDCSGPVLDKSIFQCQSCYTIPNIRVEGRSAKTHRVTNTAYRGFGAPQATFVQETVIDHLAQVWYERFGRQRFSTFQEAAFYIRELNMHRPGDLMLTQTLISTKYAEHLVQTLYKTLKERAHLDEKLKEITDFNQKHRFIKRGLAVTPLRNSVNFEENFMNQASALIHIYRDGSVALSHSGIEMGQSLHTKMAMVCAEVLEIPLEYVRVINTNTSRCPNSQPTAASSGADINGKATRMAAEELKENLREWREKLAGKSWGDICNICYFNRVRLTAQSFATLPSEIEWHWPEKRGCSGFYTAYGIAASIVEVNGLTGEFQVLEQFIQKDVGSPLNPLVDCGQIEGGFGMGMGLLTTEEIIWEQGNQLTKTSNYAFSTMVDVPRKISVEIQKDVPNPANIFDSKASAESPTCLGAAVYYAIKNAIRELRVSMGKAPENTTDALGNKYLKTSAPLPYRAIFATIEQQ